MSKADAGLEEMVQNKLQYYFLEAVCQQEKGNFAEAYELLDQCRKIDPSSAEVWYMLSRYYYNMKDAAKARTAMEKAAELAPKNDYYLEMVAEFCIQNKEYDKAIAAFQKIYENDHERGDILERLVQLGAMANDYDKVLWALNKLEILEGKSERLSMTKYRILLEQKKDSEALDELQALANKYFNDLNYKVLLGDYYSQHEKDKEALDIYNEVLAQEPDNLMAQSALYSYYQKKDMFEDAYRMSLDMVNNKSLKPEYRTQIIGWAISENAKIGKDSTENIRLFRSILEQRQDDAAIQLMYANYLESINMPVDSVIPEYEKVLAMEHDNEAAAQRLIGIAWDSKDFDQVIKLCSTSRQYHPDGMLYYYYEGLAHFQKKEHKDAIDVFQRGISTINDDTSPALASDFYALLGDLYFQEGMKREAYCAYDSCLQWQADNIGCLNNYAYYLSLDGKELDKAEKMSYKTIKKEKENATYIDTYAWILFKQKRYSEARIYIDKALEHLDSISSTTEIYDHAGDIYFQNGETDKAVEFWNKALKLKPQDKLLQRKIRKRRMF